MGVFKRLLPLILMVTCTYALIYFVAQQNLRLGANDPQIQIVEDTAAKLTTDNDTLQITSLPRVDMSRSLSSFVITFDQSGKQVSSSGDISGKVPTPPMGVFAYTKEHGEDRFTWQPQTGVRIAAVMQHYNGRTSGYVLSGRSLREIEKRENMLTTQVALAWLITLLITFVTVAITSVGEKRKK